MIDLDLGFCIELAVCIGGFLGLLYITREDVTDA